jgi:purine-binding chemotaxis protein CheW
MMNGSNEQKGSATGNNHTKQIVVFKLGEEEYGLSIDQIKEVVITPNITRMPQTPSFVKGVANIRGNIIAILDLEEKFGLVRSVDTSNMGNNYTLVIESDEYKMGILVREVPNTLSVSLANIEDTIFTGDQQPEQSYITGIIKLDKRLIIMIDIFKVITEQETHQLFKRQNLHEGGHE